MPQTRRQLLTSFTGAGLSAALLSLGSPLHAESFDLRILDHDESEAGIQVEQTDQSSFDFWSSNIRDPNLPRSRDVGSAPRAMFVYYDPANGFVTGSDIGDSGLPDRGDLNLIVNVDHIHLSTRDQARFMRLDGGSLRIDVQQTAPLPSLPERLGWTSIAGLLPSDKKLPAVKDMNFNPGTTWGKLQSIPLPGGGGRWTWNFFFQQRKSRWMQLFELIQRDKNLLMPIFGLGLPAIAVTALSTVDNIVAELTKNANTEWLFQSPDIYVYGTKKARDTFEGSKLRLRQGMYVIVPDNQLSYFSKQAAGLTIKDGLIVPKNTKSLDVPEVSRQTLPELTYLTVGVTARMAGVAHQA
jgi:hypothetical protein